MGMGVTKEMLAEQRQQNAIISGILGMSKLFFKESPLQRYLARGGRGRKLMQKYRAMKRSRRPKCFRQDVW